MTTYTLTQNQMRLLRYGLCNQKQPLIAGEDSLKDLEALEAMSLVVIDREDEELITWSIET